MHAELNYSARAEECVKRFGVTLGEQQSEEQRVLKDGGQDSSKSRGAGKSEAGMLRAMWCGPHIGPSDLHENQKITK